jgi:hypothetical protein
MKTSHISEALSYFLDEKTVCDEIDFPDRGIDYAFMMRASDWLFLLEKWKHNSEDWKIAITYYAGFSSFEDSSSILFKGLESKNEELIIQTLFSIYESLSAEIDNENNKRNKLKTKNINKINYTFSKIDKQNILTKITQRNSLMELHPELKELQKIIIENK